MPISVGTLQIQKMKLYEVQPTNIFDCSLERALADNPTRNNIYFN
jgi:hypothetical protein